ncbi:hypothetical protein [Aquimarina pacifica]|uniref:hypothetical protein n=1 Tax=Aquimarina pacifica TaxID=1296415 RepID=UPI00047179AB|nr:hypothetical protein [Aquimarina pacifica]
MKSIYLFLVSIFLFSTLYAQTDTLVFTPSKTQKIKSTFSGTLHQKTSAHFVILEDKTSDNFAIKLFVVEKEDTITEFDLVFYEKNPTILSHHVNNNTITILTRQTHVKKNKRAGTKSFSNKGTSTIQLTITDFNIETKEITKRNIARKKKNEDRYIQTPESTICLQYKDDHLFLNKITNSQIIDSLKIKPKKEDLKIAKEIFTNYQFVDTKEYVEKGSLSSTKAYFYDDTLFFTHSNTKKNQIVTTVLNFDKNETPVFRTTPLPKNITSVATYVVNKDLFIFCRNMTDMYLNIDNIITGESKYKTALREKLASHFDTEILNKLHKKLSRKTNYPIITVNESIDHNLVLRFDYANPQTYSYHHNLWFHQQMMWNQQMMMQQIHQNTLNNLPRFGPNPIEDIAGLFFKPKKKDLSLKLVLDSNYAPLKDANTETIKVDIDKNEYLNNAKKTYDIKYVSMAFLNDSYRYIQYAPSSNSVTIKKEEY